MLKWSNSKSTAMTNEFAKVTLPNCYSVNAGLLMPVINLCPSCFPFDKKGKSSLLT